MHVKFEKEHEEPQMTNCFDSTFPSRQDIVEYSAISTWGGISWILRRVKAAASHNCRYTISLEKKSSQTNLVGLQIQNDLMLVFFFIVERC